MPELVECPDWLQDEESTYTPEDVRGVWRRLLAQNLVGRKVLFANRGGDMLRFEGIIASVSKTTDGVVIEAHSVKIYDESERDEDGEAKLVEECPSEEFVLLEYEPPTFSRDGRDRTIILPAGLGNFEGMDIGFIY